MSAATHVMERVDYLAKTFEVAVTRDVKFAVGGVGLDSPSVSSTPSCSAGASGRRPPAPC